MYTNTCLPVNEIFVSESLGTIGRHAEQLVTRRLGLVARYHSCEQKPVRAQELEDAFAAWLETCRPMNGWTGLPESCSSVAYANDAFRPASSMTAAASRPWRTGCGGPAWSSAPAR